MSTEYTDVPSPADYVCRIYWPSTNGCEITEFSLDVGLTISQYAQEPEFVFQYKIRNDATNAYGVVVCLNNKCDKLNVL
jgi:hypothetical protein